MIPPEHVEAVAQEGPPQEEFEAWVVTEVEKGQKLPGLYPPNAENKARYEAQRKKG